MPLSALIYFITPMKWSEMKSLSRVQLSATPWTVAHQAPPSMGFSRQEYCSGLPFPSPGDLPDPGIKPRSPASRADASTSEPPGKPNHPYILYMISYSWFLQVTKNEFKWFSYAIQRTNSRIKLWVHVCVQSTHSHAPTHYLIQFLSMKKCWVIKEDYASIRRMVLPLTTYITLNKSFNVLSLDFLICKFVNIITLLRHYSGLHLWPTFYFPKIVNQEN